ncbi:helix-turn-helix transcriptional regulator [Sulfitobacter sp. SK011]|uniref:helix-turn-helix transcriptional regulator n=1 Tax=Sulfitobacter sp. SK011 TaxID=1389004 RepID=UPI000E0AEED3|nr:helix-turn-helix transcriptional regulator [Sulfitobacter sp. SK011]AXI41881.1 XRE family transcriptional regulator [Sulfitobacter sp. SK011]
MNENFAKNLRHICAERVSTAQICREIGINPQQFNRYLSGAGMPSAHNLRRIALYFDVMEHLLLSDNATFVAARGHLNRNRPSVHKDPFANAFPGDLARLRHYAGAYHIHFLTPSWPDHIMIGATFIDEENGQMNTRTIERGRGPSQERLQRTRYDGRCSFHGSRIFVVEFESEQEGSITETVLYPAHRQQRTYLRGMTLGLAWRPRRMPYSSRAIWKKIESRVSLRSALEKCGIYPVNHASIDPTIRNFLLEKTGMAGEE